MNQGCIRGYTDQIDCESALLQLVLRYIVSQGCFVGGSDWIGCETDLPVLVLGYIVN